MTTDTDTIKAQESTFVELDPGVYDAKITSIERGDGDYGPQLKFVFTIIGQTKPDGSPVDMWAWASLKLTPRSKLWKWSSNLGMQHIVGQSEYKTSDFINQLVGRSARVLVSLKDSDAGPRPAIEDVYAPKPGAASAPASAPAAPEQPAEFVKCCIPSCQLERTVYDADANPYCDKHNPAGK